jgi:nucleotide-binding universal stress UspA family protein
MSVPYQSKFQPRRILVPVDFSVSSDAGLEAASELARLYGAELHLLHVIPVLPSLCAEAFLPQDTFDREAMERAEQQLKKAIDGLQRQGLSATYSIEVGNDVVGNILHTLKCKDADLLVFSTHGTSGWRPVVFGSIAEKVMRLAPCPVLLLRSAPTAESRSVEEAAPEAVAHAAA